MEEGQRLISTGGMDACNSLQRLFDHMGKQGDDGRGVVNDQDGIVVGHWTPYTLNFGVIIRKNKLFSVCLYS